MNKYIMVYIDNDTIGFDPLLNYVESEIDDIVEFYFDLEGVEEDEREGMVEYIDVEDGGSVFYYHDGESFVKIKKIKSWFLKEKFLYLGSLKFKLNGDKLWKMFM